MVPGQGAFERQPIEASLSHQYVLPSLSPPLPLSLKMNQIFKKKKEGSLRMLVYFQLATPSLHPAVSELPRKNRPILTSALKYPNASFSPMSEVSYTPSAASCLWKFHADVNPPGACTGIWFAPVNLPL